MSMPAIVMYTTNWCPYCERARRLLKSKGASFEEIDVESAAEKRAEMRARSGRRTVPQIFIGERHVGGYDDLVVLDREGGLLPLLSADPRAGAATGATL
jgi:glutaredoxin 3